MKFQSIVVATLLAGLASAQSLTGLPVCAQSCVVAAIPQSCNLDPKCICESTSFIKGITCCVFKACDKADQEATIKYANGICNPVGISDLPTAATCSKTASGAAVTSSGSATSSGSMSMTSSMMAASSSVSAAASSMAAASSVSAAGSSAASAASAVTPSQTPNVGNVLFAQGMGVMGAVAGALALI